MTARCEFSDLPVDGCAHCTGYTGDVPERVPVKPVIAARFAGRCAECNTRFAEGDLIGHGPEGWVGMSCCGEETR